MGKRGSQAGLTLIELLISMIIMSVIGTMLVGGWISLQRAYAFTSVTNSARATARDALDRVSSEIRMAQPPTADPLVKSPFYLPATPPTDFSSGSPLSACGPTTCVFYSAYNNYAVGDGGGLALTGTMPPTTSAIRLTAIWLDTAGSTAQKVLKLTRDTDNDGDLKDPGGFKTIILARSVVNTAVSRPLFIYYFRDATTTSPTYGQWSHADTLTSASVANLRNVQIELVIDANLSHTPTYVDVRTTVRPRNAATIK